MMEFSNQFDDEILQQNCNKHAVTGYFGTAADILTWVLAPKQMKLAVKNASVADTKDRKGDTGEDSAAQEQRQQFVVLCAIFTIYRD